MTLLYFLLLIVTAFLWWGTPFGWLAVFSVVQEAISLALARSRLSLERQRSIRMGVIGVEMTILVYIASGVVNLDFNLLLLFVIAAVWGAGKFARDWGVMPDDFSDASKAYDRVGEQLEAMGDLAILSAFFVVWRGDTWIGAALLLYGAGATMIGLRFEKQSTRRFFAIFRVFLLCLLGLARRLFIGY